MNRRRNHLKANELQGQLAAYFEAPQPIGKRSFVRQFEHRKISMSYMVMMQAKYISKWVWLFSVLFCVLSVYLAVNVETGFVNVVYACIPFLVMLSVTESTRSYRYGMDELEMAARFSLKSIVMARMVMLGVGNLAVLVGVYLLPGSFREISLLYLLAPYFLTAGGGLCITRRMRGSEGTFLCFALAALVSAVQLYLPCQFREIFTPEHTLPWMAVCGVGIVITVRESYRIIRETENYVCA